MDLSCMVRHPIISYKTLYLTIVILSVTCVFILWRMTIVDHRFSDNIMINLNVCSQNKSTLDGSKLFNLRVFSGSENMTVDASSEGTYLQIENQTRKTTILLWTPYFGNRNWWFSEMGIVPCQETASHPQCTVTNDKTKICEADVVMFNCRDDIRYKKHLIRNRRPEQLFVVFCHESPSHSSLGDVDVIGMNASATYRRDSDFPGYYGRIVPKLNKSDVGHYIRQVAWSDKRKSVVWITGNCNPTSHRDLLAKELSKYIDVDIFGSCGKRRCSQNTPQCIKDFAKDYKFYLSFENSLCHDYVTEKFFNAMAADIIPVVYGGANYSQIAPDHSFINAREFSSPKQLAEYLKQVGNNKTEYDKYLDWKKYHELIPTNPSLECTLCDAHRSQFTKMAGPLEGWWNTGACHNDHLYQWRRNWTSGQQRNWYWLNMYY